MTGQTIALAKAAPVGRAVRKIARMMGAGPETPAEIALLELRLKQRSVACSTVYPGHHKIFERFPPPLVEVPEDHAPDYFGALAPCKFGHSVPQPGAYRMSLPSIGEDYFELVDAMESVLDAGDTYTFMEWGAGFGRWTALAIGAARLHGVKHIRAALCEGEPVHAQWIHEFMSSMNVPPSDYRVFQAALGGAAGETIFMVRRPEGGNPADWYGQGIGGMDGAAFQPTDGDYHGHRLFVDSWGWKGIYVPLLPPSEVLQGYDFVDLIDMDIQGEEADAVEECIDLLDQRVRRLHIGTHSRDIEVRLRNLLSAHGWILIREFQGDGPADTPFGPIDCLDGIQSWFNPRHAPKGWSRGLAV